MNATIKEWLTQLYEKEIHEAKGTIQNERIWEMGYDGDEPNPHTQNIAELIEYIKVLQTFIRRIKNDKS